MNRNEIDEYAQRCQQLIETSPQMDKKLGHAKIETTKQCLRLAKPDVRDAAQK